MAEDEWALIPDQHQRTIVHFDVDCFYAQVEMVRDPSLRDKPLGIKQKNLMVTSNYVARSMGVKKSMWIKDAVKILPSLVFVDGSDLTHYRQFSTEISAVAQTFTPNVERLGLDENYVDITDIVGDYISPEYNTVEGHVFGDKEEDNKVLGDPCGCGCLQRLTAGSHLAKKIRQQILETTGITCCAGVAHNKLLAKLISGYYKPNQQTVVFPWQVHDVMESLKQARSIPGIGSTTFKILEDLSISTVQELQNASLSTLHTRFDEETSKRLKDLSYGIDESLVRKSGKPQSIGLEDAFKKVSSIAEVRIKYHTLLGRLLKLLAEDGRVPGALKVSVRKFDKELRFGHRETKQVPLLASLFSTGVRDITEKTKSDLMNLIITLFHKMVDVSKPFHLTLVGVGFTKFIERAKEGKAISSFFSKTSKEKRESIRTVETKPLNVSQNSKGSCKLDSKPEAVGEEPRPLDIRLQEKDTSSEEASDTEDFHQPLEDVYSEKTYHHAQDQSPNSENKADDEAQESAEKYPSEIDRSKSLSSQVSDLPTGIDREVFESLPSDLQAEVLRSYQASSLTNKRENKTEGKGVRTPTSKSKIPAKCNVNRKRSLDVYFKNTQSWDAREGDSKRVNLGKETEKTSELNSSTCDNLSVEKPSCSRDNTVHKDHFPGPKRERNGKAELPVETENNMEVLIKKGIDPDVFNSLPKELQAEILGQEKLEKLEKPVFSPLRKRTQNSKVQRNQLLF
ncbi:DNA polymerase iota-like [Penaeus chinensis]|uniref:DNA polymerase iota-like n=1 Tax=Penaeus chinensis TaxID=139456 RepID=UPI001FB5F876|nr:DNA polymerase iota-like [Penaeus chinensis]XP_047501003.1 DNA polymerase iota-like [Penaeus chinensis]